MQTNNKILQYIENVKAVAYTLLSEAENIEKLLEVKVKVSPKRETENKMITDMLMKRQKQRIKKQSKIAA